MTAKGNTGLPNPSLHDVKKHWLGVDSHFVFEGHLPHSVPLKYVKKVIMPKNIWVKIFPFFVFAHSHWLCNYSNSNSIPSSWIASKFQELFSKQEREQLNNVFKNFETDYLVIFNKDVSGDPNGTFPLDPVRKELMQFTKQFCESKTRLLHCFSFTIAALQGKEVTLPKKFKRPGFGHVYVSGKGEEFFVVLSTEGAQPESITIFFGGSRIYISKNPPILHKYKTLDHKEWFLSENNFNVGFDTTDTISYHISYDKSRGLLIEHSGSFSYYSSKPIICNDGIEFPSIRFDILDTFFFFFVNCSGSERKGYNLRKGFKFWEPLLFFGFQNQQFGNSGWKTITKKIQPFEKQQQ